MSIENRYIRIEDWNGNVYYPESSSAETTAGSVTDSSSASTTDPTSDVYTKGSIVADTSANNGSAIFLKANTERQVLFRTLLSNVPFGNTSIGIRLKSSIGTGVDNLIEVNTYFVDKSGDNSTETLLDTSYINGNTIGAANEYVNLGIVTNYRGIATGQAFLKVELILLPDTGVSIYFDQIAVAMALPAETKAQVYVDGSVIIVP